MKRMIAATLMIIAASTAARAQRQRTVTPPVPVSDWKIEITTDGGFTGNGSGGLLVSSDGILVMTLGPSSTAKRCTFQLSKSELQVIDAAVRSANPAAWLECYSLADVKTHCCDLIRTTLSLTTNSGRDQSVTSWLNGTLPSDLQALLDVLRGSAGVDVRYRPLCATTP